jgi:hypothetical protein
MSKQMMKLATLVGAALAMMGGVANAESQYGYNAAGAGSLTATARVNITVNTPKLILLRVGGSGGTAEAVALNASLSGGIPGGVASPADGTNTATGWNEAVPVWTNATATQITASAWTNSSGGGKVTSAVTTPFAVGSGLTAANIEVASTTVSGGGLAHPGLNTGTSVDSPFARNTVASSTWVYSVSAAVLAGVASGANSQVVTYTATTL